MEPREAHSWRHSWHFSEPALPSRPTAPALSSSSLPRPSDQKKAGTSGLAWGRRMGANPVPTLRPPTPEIARTAPPTPVRELVNGERKTNSLTKTRFSSTPLIDPGSDWDLSSDWINDDKDERSDPARYGETTKESSRHISESVLQKFRKSFSLKFYRKGGSKEEEEESESPVPPADSPPPQPPPKEPPESSSTTSSEKFRFGPLVWRSSKERKKGKKAARNAKCNSGDSGIQIEMVGRGYGDSSESQHDTDHLGDEETMDDLDSPPVVRRRGTNTSSEGRPSRPSSDVINQILIDRLKAELEARGLRRRGGGGHTAVRRTHSDLGGQRLYNWDTRRSFRRMISTPSPIKSRPRNLTQAQLRSWKRSGGRPTCLRRSVSQPLGINELSPLMQRKPHPNHSGRNHVLSEDERGGGTSDDDMLSDSESSVASFTERKKSFELAMEEEIVILAEAVWDHVAMEPEELAFRAGDVIEVLDTLDRDWWWGAKGEQTGWFPSAFVRLRVSQEDTVEDCLAAVAAGQGSKSLRRRVSVSLLSNDQVRSRVVTELINTERDFVKVLQDVKEGYLVECRRRDDMFTEEQLKTIFGNLEELLDFQKKFLGDLEGRVDWEAPQKSCVADTFLLHHAGFRMYSEYCNCHPMAIATLQELYQHVSYSKFFEACRLMRGLMEIPLDGYLLTPVQRICKYPLQLAELLKYTKTDHEDYEKIKKALEVMRNVAVLINERKRRMESLEKLAVWQQRVEGWEGEELIETSSQLIHQGDAIRVTTGMWTSNITVFLFDHQLVYCKKDILKRNNYVYKGRINMDTSEIINLNDGKDPVLGVTVRHGIKVYSCIRDKWLLFCLRSSQEKQAWLDAFKQERELVAQDLRDGLEFAPAARQLARLAAVRARTRPPAKPRSKSYKRALQDRRNTDVGLPSSATLPAQHRHLHHPPHGRSIGRKMGTWFTFKKTRGLPTIQPTPIAHPS